MLTASVVVPTYQRAPYLRTCLQHLERQTFLPTEVVVVDVSADEDTRLLVEAEFPAFRYVRSLAGPGTLATSRRVGVEATSSDVVAFLDDDAYAEPDWLEALLAGYDAADVGAVGGRALNGDPDEETVGVDQIGRLLPDGTLTGFFAADPGATIDVDHLLGANWSVRREALDATGGIRDYYPGTCLREESDALLRMRRAGWRRRFTPTAVVRHVAAPYPTGERFDLRYTYFGHRNHVVLLAATGHHRELVRFLPSAIRVMGTDLADGGRRTLRAGLRSPGVAARALVGAPARSAVGLAGLVAGLFAGAAAIGAERRRRRGPTR